MGFFSKLFGKGPSGPDSVTKSRPQTGPMLFAFGCYDYDRVLGLAMIKPELFTKESMKKTMLPKALPQRMPVPPDVVAVLCENRLTYFEPKEWDAPYVTLDPSNAVNGFSYDNNVVEPKIKQRLLEHGYASDKINLAYDMRITVPFINTGVFVIVVAFLD